MNLASDNKIDIYQLQTRFVKKSGCNKVVLKGLLMVAFAPTQNVVLQCIWFWPAICFHPYTVKPVKNYVMKRPP